jgi:hypothetical protein
MPPDCGSSAGMPGFAHQQTFDVPGFAVFDDALLAGVAFGDILVAAPMGFSIDQAMETVAASLPGCGRDSAGWQRAGRIRRHRAG